MSAPATDRLRIPTPRPRPAAPQRSSGPRHQKPEIVVITQQDAQRDPETVVLAADDLRAAAVPAPRAGGRRTPTGLPTAGLRLPSWDPLPPISPARP